ncbi:kinase-associated lipoprotein B [Halobacillus karajensis]|uniref:Kinase-associated lipoprotein B n=1 Tax=Halobacillus karajensis TaxID=195088 RepID=A0A024PB19_9BACI|nr:kinase-associated lipoprotein B [Halobacillus karajensis]CDQ21308.1 Kinase-associated lipoprotein B precursor [Halobacillus karajensis]CDQ25622.1 Kinase-associated lipoprotein B precursor [Halobacillus karajensis]CDQ25893.1 Kinase-associated lipoprotein B precursor [Halobacillus karajensis]
MSDIQNGTIVTAHYKTGIYIGEIMEDRNRFYLVKVLAVQKHPMQGDLHNPGKTENVFFHQRKALSYNEKANVQKEAVKAYDGEIPSYEESLKNAVLALKTKLTRRETEFNQSAKQQLDDLESHYFG